MASVSFHFIHSNKIEKGGCFIPVWLNRAHGEIGNYKTQLLIGYVSFQKYLARIEKLDNNVCADCGVCDNNAEHTFLVLCVNQGEEKIAEGPITADMVPEEKNVTGGGSLCLRGNGKEGKSEQRYYAQVDVEGIYLKKCFNKRSQAASENNWRKILGRNNNTVQFGCSTTAFKFKFPPYPRKKNAVR